MGTITNLTLQTAHCAVCAVIDILWSGSMEQVSTWYSRFTFSRRFL